MLSVLLLKAVLVREDLGSRVVVEQEVGTMGMAGDLGAATLCLLVDNFNNKEIISPKILRAYHECRSLPQ